jgi:hypothetical protein
VKPAIAKRLTACRVAGGKCRFRAELFRLSAQSGKLRVTLIESRQCLNARHFLIKANGRGQEAPARISGSGCASNCHRATAAKFRAGFLSPLITCLRMRDCGQALPFTLKRLAVLLCSPDSRLHRTATGGEVNAMLAHRLSGRA